MTDPQTFTVVSVAKCPGCAQERGFTHKVVLTDGKLVDEGIEWAVHPNEKL